ncbi:MAG: hypothetical protein IKP95_06205 [Ruminococcus sp.]|nr:hypothetical protein [Ruminococcus sp.]
MKLSKLAMAKKQLKEMTKRGVKVKISSCGRVLIDGLPFSFSVSSAGDASRKGIVVSFSGDPVEKGELTLDVIELHCVKNGKARTETKKLSKIVKSDGKHIYQAKFTGLELEEFAPTGKKADEEMFLADISSQYTFKTVPEYKQETDGEIMLTVYPIEEPLTGLAVEWKPCTSDKEWFSHNPDALKAAKKRRFGR